MIYTKISRELINSLEFREFASTDYHAFAGVESPIPLIAENDDENIVMIIDGDRAELYYVDGVANFDMIDSVESIRELPVKSAREIQIENRIANLKKELAELENELCY